MSALVLLVALIVIPLTAVGAEAEVELEAVTMNLEDKASLQSGARTFVNYCLGCHSAGFSRYGRVASDLGIPEDLVEENFIFDENTGIGDLMHSAMPVEQSKSWFGVAPPDLSLVAKVRSPEWLYGYLTGFYLDASRPTGVNNRVFANVAMPNVLAELQGEQLPCEDEACSATVHVEGTGSLSPEAFDDLVYDLVNFLYYLGEPARLEREKIGGYVLFFLAFLFVFVYMLNREYWKDIH
ncbi:MAG: cytochrome c1 [Pseudomonadales bacterium]|nr:cytochrome c1 [Pseudomonadales bacterium]